MLILTNFASTVFTSTKQNHAKTQYAKLAKTMMTTSAHQKKSNEHQKKNQDQFKVTIIDHSNFSLRKRRRSRKKKRRRPERECDCVQVSRRNQYQLLSATHRLTNS
jgi:hypothetical protein